MKIEVLKIGILKNYLRMKVLKINLEIGILKNYLKIKVLKIGIFENYLKMKFLKIKSENWNFRKLFENGNFEN